MSWQEKVKNRLPNLVAGKFWWVKGNIFIDDLGLDELGLGNDIPKLKVPAHILTPATLNSLLLQFFQPELFSTIIWPGEGAKAVQKSLDLGGINIAAQRIGFESPRVEVAFFQVIAEGKIAIVDDVVASGATAIAVWSQGNFKRASLVAWIMQSPHDAALRCYEKIFVGLLVRGDNGQVPINSLSTFLERQEVLEDYAQRYARDASEFIEFFVWLKKEGVSRAT